MGAIMELVEEERLTPIECMEKGVPMTEARQMCKEDLTEQDCRRLLVDGGYPNSIIAKKYGFGSVEFGIKIQEQGISRILNRQPRDTAKAQPVAKVPVQPVREIKEASEPAKGALGVSGAVIEDVGGSGPVSEDSEPQDCPAAVNEPAGVQEDLPPDALPAPQPTPADLTKEIAARLLTEGKTHPEIRSMYGMTQALQLTTRLYKWGLLEKKAKPEKPEEALPVAENKAKQDNPELIRDGVGDTPGKVEIGEGKIVIDAPGDNIAETITEAVRLLTPKRKIEGKTRSIYSEAPTIISALVEELPPISEEWDEYYRSLWVYMMEAAIEFYYTLPSSERADEQALKAVER